MEISKHDLAFPCPSDYVGNGGLTKREYFAAMAMQSLLSINDGEVPKKGDMALWNYETIATCATRAADFLITELNKEQ